MTVHQLIQKYGITLISLGNGTASRESEQVIVELLKEIPEQVQYLITNEAGGLPCILPASWLRKNSPILMWDREKRRFYCKAGAGSSGRTGEN